MVPDLCVIFNPHSGAEGPQADLRSFSIDGRAEPSSGRPINPAMPRS